MNTFVLVCGSESEARRLRAEFAASTGTDILCTWPYDMHALRDVRIVGYAVTELANMLTTASNTPPRYLEALYVLTEYLDFAVEGTLAGRTPAS